MSEVIPFVPKHELDCQKNLNDFICRAKNQLTIYEDQGGFSSSNWKHYLANGRPQSMEFTGLAEKGRKTGSPMEPPANSNMRCDSFIAIPFTILFVKKKLITNII